jgi:hypothetical protein
MDRGIPEPEFTGLWGVRSMRKVPGQGTDERREPTMTIRLENYNVIRASGLSFFEENIDA